VRDYVRLQLHDRGHEVFVCIFLDSQHRVIACDELFRGTSRRPACTRGRW
jgi:DNA repair protein RadC